MRKFFASAFGLSLTAALVLGAAFAWSASTSGTLGATTGTVSIAFSSYQDTGNEVYDGAGWTQVDYGNFANTTPANPGLALRLIGGSVTNIQANGCQSYMAGDVQITDNSYVAPGSVGGQWISRLQINGSPDSCQGQAVSYDINLTAGS